MQLNNVYLVCQIIPFARVEYVCASLAIAERILMNDLGAEYSLDTKTYNSKIAQFTVDRRPIEYSIGNCFPTKQAAEDAVRVLKLIQKSRESQGGFVPDWEDDEQYKFSLCSDRSGFWISSYISLDGAPIFGFWEDESVCDKFIKDNYADLLWYFKEYRR